MAMQGMQWSSEDEGFPDTERNPVPYVGLRDDEDEPTLPSQRVPPMARPRAPMAWIGLVLWAGALVVFLERHPLQALGVLLILAGTWWLVRDVRLRGAL